MISSPGLTIEAWGSDWTSSFLSRVITEFFRHRCSSTYRIYSILLGISCLIFDAASQFFQMSHLFSRGNVISNQSLRPNKTLFTIVTSVKSSWKEKVRYVFIFQSVNYCLSDPPILFLRSQNANLPFFFVVYTWLWFIAGADQSNEG